MRERMIVGLSLPSLHLSPTYPLPSCVTPSRIQEEEIMRLEGKAWNGADSGASDSVTRLRRALPPFLTPTHLRNGMGNNRVELSYLGPMSPAPCPPLTRVTLAPMIGSHVTRLISERTVSEEET